jgi:hypothetical protein
MVLLLVLLGIVLVVIGSVLFFRQKKSPGGILILLGALFIALGAMAILSFHP